MNILIVDDEVQLVKAVSAILKKNNFNTDYALDGEDGWTRPFPIFTT